MKRSRVAAVTRAAKQMALDVRKESLLEEFVKDLIQELEESKRVVGELREITTFIFNLYFLIITIGTLFRIISI